MHCHLLAYIGALQFRQQEGMNVAQMIFKSNCKKNPFAMLFFMKKGGNHIKQLNLEIGSQTF